MRRREFITLLGGAAATVPLAVRAQQPAMPVIGFLSGALEAEYTPFVAAFRRGLSETGFVEGRNVAIEYRWAEGRYDRLPALAGQLVQRQIAVLVASGGDNSAYAAKAATSTIPVVFLVGIDPSKVGLVASLNRPGGNTTGVSLLAEEIVSKQVDLLRSLLPNLTAIGMLVDPDNPNGETQLAEAEAAAHAHGIRVAAAKAHAEQELDAAFASLAAEKVDALVVGASAAFVSQRVRIVDLASRHALPAIYFQRSIAAAGGLISYGANVLFIYRQLGIYTGIILKGAKPSDLPVLLPTKFELAINLKTARELHLDVPPMLLALTDEVIE